MPIIVEPGQRIEQQFGDTPTITEDWYVFGTDDRILARQALIAGSPDVSIEGLLRTSVRIVDFTDDCWLCEIVYGIKRMPKEGEVRIMVDGEGGREKIYQALAVVDAVGIAGRVIPDTMGVIGYESDGTINGVEIEVSGATILMEFHVSRDVISNAYLAKIARMSKKVNLKKFKGYDPGELRFKKYTFEDTIKLDEEANPLSKLTLEFVVEENVTALQIGGLPPINKRGHDYLWVYSEEMSADPMPVPGGGGSPPPPKMVIKRPVFAFVNQVYHYADFKVFGIGS